MSANLEILKEQSVEYDALCQQLIDLLLGPESPVESEAAFKRDRAEYNALTQQRLEHTESIERLHAAADEVRQAENAVSDARTKRITEEKLLRQLARRLGKTAFRGLVSGELQDHPRYSDRQALQAQIDSLHQQKSSTSAGQVDGVMARAKAQALQLKLASQIKIEELKIGSVDQILGKTILESNEEDAVRCCHTEDVLAVIASQRLRIRSARQAIKHAESQLLDRKLGAAAQLQRSSVTDSASLSAELRDAQSALRLVENRIDDIRELVLKKALGYEWLRDNSSLKEMLDKLSRLQADATPRKLSVWPLAIVVITGHLLTQFGSEPLNPSASTVLLLYLATGLGGLVLLSYYKPEIADGEARYKSLLLLFTFSVISVVSLLAFQSLAEFAVSNWAAIPSWSQNHIGMLFDLPRRLLVTIGQAYRDTFAIMFATGVPESTGMYFRDHMLSVGLCEETVKLTPTLIAFAAITGPWHSRGRAFNSRLVYLSMIGGLAFGLGEAVYYHFTMYAPEQLGWGIYATRFLTLVTIHAVWAGISGWILAHITGGWILRAFTTFARGWGPVGGCLMIAATVGISDALHTTHNLSVDPVWTMAWDVVSLALFAWLIRCSSVSQLIPEVARKIWKRGLSFTDVTASVSRLQQFALGNTKLSEDPEFASTTAASIEESDDGSSLPKLWNPNAAGFWSLILSPVFGAWLHARNWRELGHRDRANRSMRWVYASIGILVAAWFIGFFQMTHAVLLVSWWLRSGNEQLRYVSEKCPHYRKRHWGTPMSIAGITIFIAICLSFALAIDRNADAAMQQIVGVWSCVSFR